MQKLYFLGGPPRAGKSIIMNRFLHERPMHHISTDAVQEGVRHLFNEDPFQVLRDIHFEGYVEYKKRGTTEQVKDEFNHDMKEVDVARKAVIGMLDHYERARSDVAIEGLHVTLEWLRSLNFPGFTIVAAFVGYTNPDFVEGILEHARNNEHDWINEWLASHNGDQTRIREWVKERNAECKETKKLAEEYGFPFFDASAKPFPEYVSEVVSYLSGH